MSPFDIPVLPAFSRETQSFICCFLANRLSLLVSLLLMLLDGAGAEELGD